MRFKQATALCQIINWIRGLGWEVDARRASSGSFEIIWLCYTRVRVSLVDNELIVSHDEREVNIGSIDGRPIETAMKASEALRSLLNQTADEQFGVKGGVK